MIKAINNKWISKECQRGWVSVIIPTFNREVYLQQALQSVYKQNYRPIECIIIDDGSTDCTKKVVKRFIEMNDQKFMIKYIYQKNSGSQIARNIGTSASTGEFIQYLDSDDLLYPDKIKNQVEYLETNKDCDGVFGDWRKGTPDENELIRSFAGEDLITQFLTEHCIHTLSFLMRRTLVEKIGPWDINIKRNQEIDFHLKGLLIGAKYHYQSQICGLWRIHSGKRIANTSTFRDLMNFFQKWERVLAEKGLFKEEMKKNIANIYYWSALKNTSIINNDNKTILEEALRLNPNIPFANSKKMRIMRRILGRKNTLRVWLLRSKL